MEMHTDIVARSHIAGVSFTGRMRTHSTQQRAQCGGEMNCLCCIIRVTHQTVINANRMKVLFQKRKMQTRTLSLKKKMRPLAGIRSCTYPSAGGDTGPIATLKLIFSAINSLSLINIGTVIHSSAESCGRVCFSGTRHPLKVTSM